MVSGEGDGTLTEREAAVCRTYEINKESRQNEGRKRRRNGIAMSAGKRQALKHGEVDVLPGSGVRGDDVFAGTPVTICRFNNTKSFRLTFEPLGKCLLIKDVAGHYYFLTRFNPRPTAAIHALLCRSSLVAGAVNKVLAWLWCKHQRRHDSASRPSSFRTCHLGSNQREARCRTTC